MGNGLVAIVAGLLGHALVEIFQLGPVSPFDAAALVLLIGGAYIAFTWTENYGETSEKAPFHVSLVNAGRTIWEGELLACCHTPETACCERDQQVACQGVTPIRVASPGDNAVSVNS